jgi:hypothetical protein
MAQQLTSLIEDLRRLVLEIEKSSKGNAQDEEKKEIRLLEGQIQARDPDTVLASKLRNAAVYSPDEARIGDVNDLLIKPDGKVEGVVVSVEDKNVALKLERFQLKPEPDGQARIILGAKKEELQEAPGFSFEPAQA